MSVYKLIRKMLTSSRNSFKTRPASNDAFVNLLYQHRDYLKLLWHEIHQEDKDIAKLIKDQQEKHTLVASHCFMCGLHHPAEPMAHLGIAIRLCKLAGKFCQHLKFSLTETSSSPGQQAHWNGYIFQFGYSSYTLTNYHDLDRLLTSR